MRWAWTSILALVSKWCCGTANVRFRGLLPFCHESRPTATSLKLASVISDWHELPAQDSHVKSLSRGRHKTLNSTVGGGHGIAPYAVCRSMICLAFSWALFVPYMKDSAKG